MFVGPWRCLSTSRSRGRGGGDEEAAPGDVGVVGGGVEFLLQGKVGLDLVAIGLHHTAQTALWSR